MSNREVIIPPKFASLFEPARPAVYDANGVCTDKGHKRKRFYLRAGGRASGKSNNFATAAVLRAYAGFERILCARETQVTIAQSVHRLLKDKIKQLGLEDFFTITDTSIKVPHNGSEFIFKGLGNNIDESVRSVENISICYVEESQSVTEYSWSVLLPSVLRTPTSEIWVAWNPNTKDDPVYKRFVDGFEPERMDFEMVNYYDNPFLPEGIREQLESDKKRDYESFRNVWLGEPKTARDGGLILPEKIGIIEAAPAGLRLSRSWDLASSAVIQKKNGTFTDPDFTVGALMGFDLNTSIYYILDIVRLRGTPDVVEAAIINTAARDGASVEISMAQDPGQAGLAQVSYYAKKLTGYLLHTSTETGSKAVRANGLASQINANNTRMLKATWNEVVINELRSFNGEKNGEHDDITDALSRCFSRLSQPQYMTKARIF